MRIGEILVYKTSSQLSAPLLEDMQAGLPGATETYNQSGSLRASEPGVAAARTRSLLRFTWMD